MSLPLLLDDGRTVEIEAVLFDMDGTIVDSIEATERIWTSWAADHGVLERLRIDHGRPAEHTIRTAMPHLEGAALEEAVAEQRALEAADLVGIHPMTGVHELIGALETAGIPWAVVTSADLTLALARMGACGIRPPVLVTREDVRIGKPDPEPFTLGAQRVGRPAARCLVVEDTIPGVDSGRGAGCITAGLGALGSDVRINDLPDLHARLLGSDEART